MVNLAVLIEGRSVALGLLYSLARALTDVSDKGLELWLDDAGLWQWRWQSLPPSLQREGADGFDSLGEAVIAALLCRYPESFACPYPCIDLDSSPFRS